jgi:hypothetical protein
MFGTVLSDKLQNRSIHCWYNYKSVYAHARMCVCVCVFVCVCVVVCA